LTPVIVTSALLSFALCSANQHAAAQAAPPAAGSQIQQIPKAPPAQRSIPEIRIERDTPQLDPAGFGDKILVRSLRVTGSTKFTEAELIAAAEFQPGSELDIPGLRAIAGRISKFYNDEGFFVAQAYVPAQQITDGTVTIAVIEGRLGKVSVNNQTRLSDQLAANSIDNMDPGDVVETGPLERRLLLLSDIPGVEVRSTLTPGASVGTSDLVVDVTPGDLITGSIEADNAGNRYTGAYRVGGTINLNNPLGWGDVATLRALTSFSGLNYVRGSYQGQVHDLTIGAAYAYLDYKLGKEFAPLQASGTANIASIYASYPLMRSRNNNLYAVVNYDRKSLHDKIGVTSSVAHRNADVVIAGLTGDHHDNLGGGAWTFYALNWAVGELRIRSPLVLAADAATARSNGRYHKFGFEAARLQQIAGPLSLYAAVRGQIASKNLDASEKMELGGAYAVRAYPEGEAYGDQGYVLNVEARMMLPQWSERMPGEMQLIAFVDNGHVTLNKKPWTMGPNGRTLSAYGVGFTWSAYDNFSLKASYARKLGNEVATSAPDKSGRVWVQVSKLF